MTLEQKLAKLETELKTATKKIGQLDQIIDKKSAEKAAATEELRDEILQIEAPLEVELNKLVAQRESAVDKKDNLNKKISSVRTKFIVEQARTVGWDNESARALAEMYGIFSSTARRLIKYKNGITIMSICVQNQTNCWFAVYDGKVIGIVAKRVPEHVADPTFPFAWVGIPRISLKNAMKLKVPAETKAWYGGKRTTKGYREIARELKEVKNPSKVRTIPPTKENTQALHSALYYSGWGDKI